MRFSILIWIFLSFFHLSFAESATASSQKIDLFELFTPLLTPESLRIELQKGWDAGGSEKEKAFLQFAKHHKLNLKKIENVLASEEDLVRNSSELIKQGLELWSLCLLIGLESESDPLRFQKMLFLPLKLSLNMTFTESTIEQMRWGFQFRDRFLILVERQLQEKKAVLLGSQALSAFSILRWIWPVDRVLLDESKLKVRKEAWPLAQKIISEIQKTPYQSIKKVMESKKWESKSIADWSLTWTEQDVKNLRTELTTVSKLQLSWAVLRFKSLKNKQPESQQTLINAGFLSAQAIDFFSGLPLPLPQL